MMNQQARVWIYQSDRTFNTDELADLKVILSAFTQSWTAHNQQLQAAFEWRYDRFIVLIVDETQAGASGCSIDKSVHLMKEVEQRFHVNLFDRFHIAWKEGEVVESASREVFEQKIKEGMINAQTVVFNNLVPDYAAYQVNWEIPFKDSWHSKVFKSETIF